MQDIPDGTTVRVSQDGAVVATGTVRAYGNDPSRGDWIIVEPGGGAPIVAVQERLPHPLTIEIVDAG